MTENTDGTADAAKTAQESSTAEQTPQVSGDTDATKGVQDRVNSLTGELGRKNDKIDKLQARIGELEETTKSEDDKRIEQLAKERYGDDLQRLDRLNESLNTEFDALYAYVPEEYQDGVAGNGPIEDRLRQVKTVLRIVDDASKSGAPTTIDGAGNPERVEKRTYTAEEFHRVARLGTALEGTHEREEYDKLWPELRKAAQDNRVVGLETKMGIINK